MITGDNTLTGSNISYKCGISDKSKGMIICDYENGTFIEDKFDFQEDDESTEVSNHAPLIDGIPTNNLVANEGLQIDIQLAEKVYTN